MVNPLGNTHTAVEHLGEATAGPVCNTMELHASFHHTFHQCWMHRHLGQMHFQWRGLGYWCTSSREPTAILNETLTKLNTEEQCIRFSSPHVGERRVGSLKLDPYKTIFLFTLASGKRHSEVYALHYNTLVRDPCWNFMILTPDTQVCEQD